LRRLDKVDLSEDEVAEGFSAELELLVGLLELAAYTASVLDVEDFVELLGGLVELDVLVETELDALLELEEVYGLSVLDVIKILT